jgi:hypothetical protein
MRVGFVFLIDFVMVERKKGMKGKVGLASRTFRGGGVGGWEKGDNWE